MNDADNLEQSIVIRNRMNIEVTGVTEVFSFNEEEIRSSTNKGDLLIKGDNLHIDSLDLSIGSMVVVGSISALAYSGNDKQQKGILGRLFGI